MATASHISLDSQHSTAQYQRTTRLNAAATQRANALLEENHIKHHIYYNDMGLHNHLVHQLLSLWALGASEDELQTAYDGNKTYQRPARIPNIRLADTLHDPDVFEKHLGSHRYYADFLAYFKRRIAETSWQRTVEEYIFAGDARADDMLGRLFGGLLHPLIHLGFGVEFQQPLVVAEGLAQAACSRPGAIGEFLVAAEKEAMATTENKHCQSPKPLIELLEDVCADPALQHQGARFADGLNFRGGVLSRAGKQLTAYAAQQRVGEEENLSIRTAEAITLIAHMTGCAALRERHTAKYDFYLIHCVNSGIFLDAFATQEWLSTACKMRLLEWKMRVDLLMYVALGSPAPRLDLVRAYEPRQAGTGWDEVERRACALPDDDGHVVKLVRALAHGEQMTRQYEGQPGFFLSSADWLQLGHIAIDSVDSSGPRWVYSAGFDEAWRNVPLQSSR